MPNIDYSPVILQQHILLGFFCCFFKARAKLNSTSWPNFNNISSNLNLNFENIPKESN